VVWVYDVCLPSSAAQVVVDLRKVGVPARHTFKPVSSQEEYASSLTLGGVRAVWASQSIMYLPLGRDVQQTEGWARTLKDVVVNLDVSLVFSVESSIYSPR
jgi:dTDP-4-amino-4,6-dideoxygalactose transaminase